MRAEPEPEGLSRAELWPERRDDDDEGLWGDEAGDDVDDGVPCVRREPDELRRRVSDR